MKLLTPVPAFALTLFLALFGYAFAAIEFPDTMRDFLVAACQVREQAAGLFAGDCATWIRMAFCPEQIVFLGFALAAHAAMEAGWRVLGWWRRVRRREEAPGGFHVDRERQPSSRWG